MQTGVLLPSRVQVTVSDQRPNSIKLYTHVAVDRETFDQDGDQQVKQNVVSERHQSDEVERRPL